MNDDTDANLDAHMKAGLAFPPMPGEGRPCNQCGICCMAEPCGLALQAGVPDIGPCPILEFADGRFWCGFVRSPERWTITRGEAAKKFAADIRESLGDGTCDSTGPVGWTAPMMARAMS